MKVDGLVPACRVAEAIGVSVVTVRTAIASGSFPGRLIPSIVGSRNTWFVDVDKLIKQWNGSQTALTKLKQLARDK